MRTGLIAMIIVLLSPFSVGTGTRAKNCASLIGHRADVSCRRWRDFAALAADIAFEVDADGLLSFIAPDDVLGMSADSLLGQRAASIFFPHENGELDLMHPLIPPC